MKLWQLMNKHSPFRAVYCENNESVGAWTPWGAVKAAKDWKHEQEREWGVPCGEFQVRFFGITVLSI